MKAVELYKDFVRKNSDFVHSLESLANGLTWMLPERFSDSEIGAEAVYAILGVITSLNQHIIDTASNQFLPRISAVSSFPWSLCISALKDLEAVVEVAAQHHYGQDGKWNFIAVVEATKVFVRLALLRDNGFKMLLQGGELSNQNEDSKISLIRHGQAGNSGISNWRGYSQGFEGTQPYSPEGRALLALNRFGENAKMASNPMQLNRISQFPSSTAKSDRKPSLSGIWTEKGLVGALFLAGEFLHIVRPLIYVIFIKKYGMKSWKPWLLSLAMDVTGVCILRHVTQPKDSYKKNIIALSASEKDEVKRRKLLWAFYIMRDPFFSKYTRLRLENTEKHLRPVPIVGFLTGKFVELIVGVQTRYTYTSGS